MALSTLPAPVGRFDCKTCQGPAVFFLREDDRLVGTYCVLHLEDEILYLQEQRRLRKEEP